MRKSLTASLTLHAGLLASAFFVLPSPDEFKVDPQDAIPVDLVSIEDFSKSKAMVKEPEPKKVETPAPKPQEVVKDVRPEPKVAQEEKQAANEPRPKPVKAEEPKKEEPKAEEVKKEEPKPPDSKPLEELLKKVEDDVPKDKKPEPKKDEVKKAEETPKDKPKPEKKPEKKRPKLDLDQVAALLNKIDDVQAAPSKPVDKTGEPEKARADATGTDDRLAATLLGALTKRLSQCWSAPPSVRDVDLVVKIRFVLNPDGSLSNSPEVLNANSDPLFAATARSAIAAITSCQNYDFLPPDKYDLWREITINFNPNMMYPT